MSVGDLIFLTQNDILRKGDFPMVKGKNSLKMQCESNFPVELLDGP